MPMRVIYAGKPFAEVWKPQTPIDYLDTTLTINTLETVSADLSGGKKVQFWYIIIEQTNNGATDENLQLKITINGVVNDLNVGSAVSGQQYSFFRTIEGSWWREAAIRTTGAYDNTHTIPFICDDVGLIQVQQTSTVDATSAQIEVNIIYDLLE